MASRSVFRPNKSLTPAQKRHIAELQSRKARQRAPQADPEEVAWNDRLMNFVRFAKPALREKDEDRPKIVPLPPPNPLLDKDEEARLRAEAFREQDRQRRQVAVTLAVIYVRAESKDRRDKMEAIQQKAMEMGVEDYFWSAVAVERGEKRLATILG